MAVATYPFIEARWYTTGRIAPIELIVIHTMEAPEKPETAQTVARWLAGPTAPRASVHYCVDADSVVQCVRDGDTAWHAPGANRNSLGFEHAGSAAQSAAQWADPYSDACLERSARLAAEKCREHHIPAVWLQPPDLLAGRRGITGHAQVSRAFRRSDHFDPGPNFPVGHYLALVRAHLQDAHSTLARGDRGLEVRRLQRLLARRHFEPGPVDGLFGPATERAVRRAQRTYGLVEDGVVGEHTWRALLAGRSS